MGKFGYCFWNHLKHCLVHIFTLRYRNNNFGNHNKEGKQFYVGDFIYLYCKNASGVATFLYILCCIVEKFISYAQVDVCQLQRRVLELFISYHPTVLTVAEHHNAFHTRSNVEF